MAAGCHRRGQSKSPTLRPSIAPCSRLVVVGRLAWTGDARRGARAQAPLVQYLDRGGCQKPHRGRAGNGPCDCAGLARALADQQ